MADFNKEKRAKKSKRKSSPTKEENKKTKKSKKNNTRPTLSIALPGSILDNAQSPELRTYLAGQIARALVIFNVNEVVIFNEVCSSKRNNGVFKGATKASDPNVLLARILQYLECPQYLRKDFFPVHQDLKYAGILNPLDCPHHMRADDILDYREGVTLERPVKKGTGSFVNVGMRKDVKVDKHLKANVRVTVKLDTHDLNDVENKKYLTGQVVSPTAPRDEAGLYWGYTVRIADSFSALFTGGPYKDGYDLTVGTSERGENVHDMELPQYQHLLVVFGGLKGLEASLESDETLKDSDVSLLFDHYINTCPHQGSRTIRTEEAILVTLSAMQPLMKT